MKSAPFAWLFIACTMTAVTHARAQTGYWSPDITDNWPVATGTDAPHHAIHAVSMPPINANVEEAAPRILFWGGNDPNILYTKFFVMTPFTNPSTGASTITFSPEDASRTYSGPNAANVFCAGQTLLKDGRVLIMGGNFNHQQTIETTTSTLIFDPFASQWGAKVVIPTTKWMDTPRYYPTTIRMPDGIPIVAGGIVDLAEPAGVPVWADQDPWYTPFERNLNVNPDDAAADWAHPIFQAGNLFKWVSYPQLYPISPTEVFFAGGGGHDYGYTAFPTWRFNMSASTLGGTPQGQMTSWASGCSALVYDSSGLRIFHCGGKKDGMDESNATANVFEIKPLVDDDWTQKLDMPTARQDFNWQILPDGRILALGGSTGHQEFPVPNLPVEVYQPQIGTKPESWTTWAPRPAQNALRPRSYHSTSILLPDARVLLTGGDVGHSNPILRYPTPSAEIFTPPYLLMSDNETPRQRPRLLTCPTELTLGTIYLNNITYDTSRPTPSRMTLVALGAVTHSTDMNQRFVELSFTLTGTNTVRLTMSTSSTKTPLGWYYLFALDASGTPSWARYVKVVSNTPQEG